MDKNQVIKQWLDQLKVDGVEIPPKAITHLYQIMKTEGDLWVDYNSMPVEMIPQWYANLNDAAKEQLESLRQQNINKSTKTLLKG